MLFFHRNKRKKDCPHLLGDSFCIFWILSRQVIFTQLITLELPYARADCGPYSTDMMPVLLMHPFLAELSPNPIPHYPATFLGLFNPKHSALHVLLLSLSALSPPRHILHLLSFQDVLSKAVPSSVLFPCGSNFVL